MPTKAEVKSRRLRGTESRRSHFTELPWRRGPAGKRSYHFQYKTEARGRQAPLRLFCWDTAMSTAHGYCNGVAKIQHRPPGPESLNTYYLLPQGAADPRDFMLLANDRPDRPELGMIG